VAKVSYSPRALDDLTRLAEFLQREQPDSGAAALDVILSVIEILNTHSLIGRPVEQGFRELVISRGRSGYLALYQFDRSTDEVLIHAVRHQREVGFVDLG
jgi:addiction module RelE/StbE family toxin